MAETLKETLKRELPALLRQDSEVRDFVLELTRDRYADRAQTADRFDRILDEMAREREVQVQKWAEQDRKWHERLAADEREREAQAQKWAEQDRKWHEKLAADERKWEEQNHKWEEQNRKWDESNRRADALAAETREEFRRVHEEIRAIGARTDRKIGALSARCGVSSERAFRDALAAVLQRSFGVEVANLNEWDDEGMVFGHPDQVELDVVVSNGALLLFELKSSIDKGDVYLFERKWRWYEQRHDRAPDRRIIVSPMIRERARETARRLGIETYGDSEEVPVG